MKSEKVTQDITTDFTNKYDKKNPYYTGEPGDAVTHNQQVINNRLEEIDNKDIDYLEKQAQQWNKTLIDKDLLKDLENFDFWKEWKHKKQ
jgi:hypothetical protein